MSRVAPAASVTRCQRPRCTGSGGIEQTEKQDTWYVKRSRCCDTCGQTWSTAEVHLPMLKRLTKLETFLRRLK